MMGLKTKHNYLPLTHLGSLPVAEFLQHHWQKKPLLIHQAFTDFQSPVSADELAGFCLDDDVVSRLVVETQTPGQANSHWQLNHGPLPDSIFTQLPDTHWTLLVQHADTLDPQINTLLNAFRFIPNWRLDDIMVSYAADGGGVGPHFDYYDVFLLQGQGRRRWRLGQSCTAHSPLLVDQPMKVLAEFNQVEEWVLEPGDMLYIPPGIAHWGTAIGESITYSIGFRAPSHAELLLDYTAEIAAALNEDNRYTDPGLIPQTHPGEIKNEAVNQLSNTLHTYLEDKHQLAKWLGMQMTRPHMPLESNLFVPITKAELASGAGCRLNTFSRSAFFALTTMANQAHQPTHLEQALLFVDGDTYPCRLHFACSLTEGGTIWPAKLSADDKHVLTQLCEAALLIPAK